MKNILLLIILFLAIAACEQKDNPVENLDTNTSADTISNYVLKAPTAYFTANRNKAMVSDTIFFNNISHGDSMTFQWYFGDGATSIEIEPFHVYHKLGSYQVSLIATNRVGKDSITGTDSIHIKYLVDYEGNSYKSVIIGEQEWLAENLRSTIYPSGKEIPYVGNNAKWGSLGNGLSEESEAYCHYKGTPSLVKGALYTYAAAMKVCPNGWKLPSLNDYRRLSNFIIADQGITKSEVALHLKSKEGWCDDSDGYVAKQGLDTYGFNAFPTGLRSYFHGEWEETYCSYGYYRLSDIRQYNDVSPRGIPLTNSSASFVLISRANRVWSENHVALTDGVAVRCMRYVE